MYVRGYVCMYFVDKYGEAMDFAGVERKGPNVTEHKNARFTRSLCRGILTDFFQVKLFPDPCMCALWRA